VTPRRDADGTPERTGGAGDATDQATADETGDNPTTGEGAVLDELFAVIEERRETLPEDSYTASLFTHEKGENAVLEKLGEETTELVLAAKDDADEELVHEAADIVYHLLVLLAMKDVDISDLRAELAERR
jgi:phosphoribosyl-ATP pyrophosphohydrolase